MCVGDDQKLTRTLRSAETRMTQGALGVLKTRRKAI